MGIIHSPPDESFVSFPRLPAYPSILSYLLLPLTTFAPLPSSYICIKSSIFDVLRKGYGPTAYTSRSSNGKRLVSFLKVSCSFGKQIHSLNVILAICRGKKNKSVGSTSVPVRPYLATVESPIVFGFSVTMTHSPLRCVTIDRPRGCTRVTYLPAGTAGRGNNRLAQALRVISL